MYKSSKIGNNKATNAMVRLAQARDATDGKLVLRRELRPLYVLADHIWRFVNHISKCNHYLAHLPYPKHRLDYLSQGLALHCGRTRLNGSQTVKNRASTKNLIKTLVIIINTLRYLIRR